MQELFQAIVPLCLMALPMLLATVICVFGLGAAVVPWETALASLIPAIDALTTILIIKHYRQTLLRVFRALGARLLLMKNDNEDHASSLRIQNVAVIVHPRDE